jgi:transposase
VLLGALRELLERTNDVLGALTYLRLYVADQEKAGTARICPSCVEEVYSMIDALRLRIWRNLPWWFGVPEVEFAA